MIFNISNYIRPLFLNAEPYPLVKHFSANFTEHVNTNPYLGKYAAYPHANPIPLKNHYITYINTINTTNLTSLTSNNILFTSGCTEAIDLLIKLFCDPQRDSVGIFKPTIFLFEDIANKQGVQVETIWLEGSLFETIPHIKNSNPKLCFLCNPNNPTGGLHALESIEDFAKITKSLIVIDETYLDFTKEISACKLIEKYPHMIVIKSFSKSWGLAGLRAGTVIAHPDIIQALQAIQLPFSVNSAALDKIQSSLNTLPKIKKTLHKINRHRNSIIKKLEKSFFIKKVYPSHTNFILIEPYDLKAFYSQLDDYPFHITDMSHQIPNTLRFSLYTAKHNDLFISMLNS